MVRENEDIGAHIRIEPADASAPSATSGPLFPEQGVVPQYYWRYAGPPCPNQYRPNLKVEQMPRHVERLPNIDRGHRHPKPIEQPHPAAPLNQSPLVSLAILLAIRSSIREKNLLTCESFGLFYNNPKHYAFIWVAGNLGCRDWRCSQVWWCDGRSYPRRIRSQPSFKNFDSNRSGSSHHRQFSESKIRGMDIYTDKVGRGSILSLGGDIVSPRFPQGCLCMPEAK